MNTSSWLATWLDWEVIEVSHKGRIYPSALPIDQLPLRTGSEVFNELGGRWLLRYVAEHQLGRFGSGSRDMHYTTPTPYAPSETVSYLALPLPHVPRSYVLALDPREIEHIRGPQWIRGARGIQYILPNGFPARAIVIPGDAGGGWEMIVR